jgi:hypothetical protein
MDMECPSQTSVYFQWHCISKDMTLHNNNFENFDLGRTDHLLSFDTWTASDLKNKRGTHREEGDFISLLTKIRADE